MTQQQQQNLTHTVTESARLDLTPGIIYRYQQNRRRYRIICQSQDVRTYQTMIVYRALDLPDRGLYFHCTEQDFATRFVRIEPIQLLTEAMALPAQEPVSHYHATPEKVVDLTERGPGF